MDAPKLSELVSEKSDKRKGRAETAIIIATYKKRDVLAEHLKKLEKQTCRDFDIIIVYGEEDKFLEDAGWASILHVREKGRNGCAGAFYIGQKLALQDNYKIIIMADDDCYPEAETLVEDLVAGIMKGEKLLMPSIKVKDKTWKHGLIYHYGCLSSDVFRKIGLTFVPLFFGGEDIELLERARKAGFTPEFVSSFVSHEMPVPPVLGNEAERYHYAKGGFEAFLLTGRYFRAWQWEVFHLIAATAYWILGQKELADIFYHAIMDGSRMMLFKAGQNFSKKELKAYDPGDYDAIVESANKHSLDGLQYIKGLEILPYLLHWLLESMLSFGDFRKYFGKRILFVESNKPEHMLSMLMAESMYLRYKEGTYEIFRGRKTASIAIGLVLMALLFPFIILFSVVLLLLGIINKKGISTEGYGI